MMAFMQSKGLIREAPVRAPEPRIAAGLLEYAEGVAMCDADCAVLELLVWMRPWMGALVTHGRCMPLEAEKARCVGAVKTELEMLRAHLNLLWELWDEAYICRFFAEMPMPAWVAPVTTVEMVDDWIWVAIGIQARFQAYVELRDDYARAAGEWKARAGQKRVREDDEE